MIRTVFLALFTLSLSVVYGQNETLRTIYYNQEGDVCSKDSATYYRSYEKKDGLWVVNGYYLNETLEMVGAYSDDSFTVEEGLFVFYDEQGFKQSECEYKKGVLVRDCKYWTEDQVEIITFTEKMPVFPGGNDSLSSFIRRKTVYPPKAFRNGIQGRVVVQFIINTDGSVSDIHVVKPLEKSLDREAIRIISIMPKWQPGTQNDKPVRVKFTMPIVFGIHEKAPPAKADEDLK